MSAGRRILLVQNGDYGEAYLRFADGAPETYRDQKRSVDFVAGLAPEAEVTTLAFGRAPQEVTLAPNLRAEVIRRDSLKGRAPGELLDRLAPTHLIMRTPHPGLLKAAAQRQIPMLPVFADLFSPGGLKVRAQHWLLRRTLRRCAAPCVANHSLNASRSLVDVLGLDPGHVVPWDWSPVPLGGAPKSGVADPARPTAFYAGGLSAPKGIGDCIAAVAHLKKAGQAMTLSVAGGGDPAPWQAMAEAEGVAEDIRFIGRIPNAEVRLAMRANDFVIVPSRHSYPEGLPNTIYEGLAARSVLIISDHPAFAGRLRNAAEALVFPAGDPAGLAAAIRQATEDPALYRRLSEASAEAHDGLYVGLEWTRLVETFLADPENRSGWVADNALTRAAPASKL